MLLKFAATGVAAPPALLPACPIVNNSLCILAVVVLATPHAWSDEFGREIRPLLNKYCADCHSGDDPKGQIDFTAMRTSGDIDAGYEIWEQSAERLIARDMPPGGELQPTEIERSRILDWYQKRFVDQVEARPGLFRPRRLSATEYRNTLRSLFGFDLEVAIIEAEQTQVEKSLVMKLLPEDPPGRSGFRNDTHGNPLTTVIWDQYSYLVDHALEEFFDPEKRQFLEAYVGPIDRTLTATQAETLLRKFIPRVQRRPLPESELFEILGLCGSVNPMPESNGSRPNSSRR